MNKIFWEKYQENEINNKIVYLSDTWDEICQEIQNPEIEFDIMSPHYLCQEIYDELEFNKLSNRINKQYYLEIAGKYVKDRYINSEISNLFKLLINELQSGRLLLIEEILKDLLSNFNSGMYFDKIHNCLITILLDDSELLQCKERLLQLTKHFVVEFVLKGYSIKSIEKFIYNIFDKYTVWEHGTIITNFPHDIDYTIYENDKQKYNQVLQGFIDNLTLKQRLDKLKKYYYLNANDYYYIYHIKGISSKIEFKSGNVTFYNPSIKKYVSETSHLGDREYDKRNDDTNSINAIAHIHTIDKEQGNIHALSDIDKALDLLKFMSTSKAFLEIDESMNIVLDDKYNAIGKTVSLERRVNNQYNMLRYDNNDYIKDNLEKYTNALMVNTSLGNSLHYYRKAIESYRMEDKILNYWISLENLFSNSELETILSSKENHQKINIITEIMPKILMTHYVFKEGWDVFYYIDNLANSKQQSYFNISDKMRKEMGMYHSETTKGKTIYLYKFLDHCKEIMELVTDEKINEKLVFIHNLYFNNGFAKENLKSVLKFIERDISFLYRLRNKIVHNASYQNQFLDYYANKLSFIAFSVLNIVISTVKDNETSICTSLINNYLKYEKLKNRLEKDNQYILYQYVKKH